MKLFDRRLFAPEDGAGSAPAPAESAPSEAASASEVVSDEAAGADFSGLGGFDEVEVEATPIDVAPSPPPSSDAKGPVPPATAAPTEAPTPPPSAPPAQEATPSQPAPQETAPQAQAPVQSASVPTDPAGLLREFEANREALIDALAADARFGLNQDEATLLETEPSKVVPRLLARTYFMAMNAALTHMSNFVPSMISRQAEASRIQSEREGAFYSKFPGLVRAKHHADVMNFAKVFRQQDPNMGFDDLASLVGAAVMAKFGISPVQAPNGGAGAPVTAPVVSPPFVPARPGVSVQTTPMEDNPFMGLGGEYDE